MKKLTITLLLFTVATFIAYEGGGQVEVNVKKMINFDNKDDPKRDLPKIYKVGDTGPAGGLIFYDKGNNSGGWRYLEAAPADQSRAKWGCFGKQLGRATGTAVGTGKENASVIIETCGEPGIAAKVATDYRGGGKSDWFLPSKDELNLMYQNLCKAGLGGFTSANYWSSSEYFTDKACGQSFSGYGYPNFTSKDYTLRVRAVRAF